MSSEEKIARLAEIQDEITRLAREGMTIADEEGVAFSLASTPMAAEYGIGGLEYIPEAEAARRNEESTWDEYYEGWRSSASDSC